MLRNKLNPKSKIADKENEDPNIVSQTEINSTSGKSRYNLRSTRKESKKLIPINLPPSIRPEANLFECVVQCETCNIIFPLGIGIFSHIYEYRNESCRFRCIKCDVILDGLSCRDHYFQSIIKCTEGDENTLSKFYRCACGKRFDYLEEFGKHQLEHQLEPPRSGNFPEKPKTSEAYSSGKCLDKSVFICTVCNKELKTKVGAELHLRIHNFSSCCCPRCKLQMSIFQTLP